MRAAQRFAPSPQISASMAFSAACIARSVPSSTIELRLTAYSQLGAPRLTGRVVRVSADPRTGMSWYEASVALDPGQPGPSSLALVPGMPAEVMIVTGARTPIDYLFTPIVESLGGARCARVTSPRGSQEAGQPPWVHRADYLPWVTGRHWRGRLTGQLDLLAAFPVIEAGRLPH